MIAMLKRARLPRRWKRWSFLGGTLIVLTVAFVSGFCSDVGTAAFARLLPSGSFGHGSGDEFYAGPFSLEERIVVADVIARVKLRSVAETAEEQHHLDEFGVLEGKSYAVAMVFTFDVLEYLKGSGGAQVKAIVDQEGPYYETALGATLLGNDLLSSRDKRWDDREAILFLRKRDREPSTKQAGRYWLGYVDTYGDGYTIANQDYQVWLPDAATPTPTPAAGASAPRASAPTNIGQRFLLEEPSDDASVPSTAVANPQGTSGQSGTEQKDTIALSILKTMIAEIQAEVTAAIATGPTGFTKEEYIECVFQKHKIEREVRYKIDLDGAFYHYTTAVALDSGLPARSHAHWGGSAAFDWPETQPRTYGADWIGGRDASLFSAEYPSRVFAARPLPAGEYRIYFAEIPWYLSICDGMPDEEKKREELVVTVTAPALTLHEAFFDPVAISTAVGADATNGALTPASFAIDDTTTTTLDSIAWESWRVTIEISPSALPANHDVEFIALDGTVALRLDVDDATKSVDGDDTTLTWGVCKQPWKADDKLMLRISKSPADLTGATNELACDGAPIATVTPTATSN